MRFLLSLIYLIRNKLLDTISLSLKSETSLFILMSLIIISVTLKSYDVFYVPTVYTYRMIKCMYTYALTLELVELISLQ